jgi:hypothetical protein
MLIIVHFLKSKRNEKEYGAQLCSAIPILRNSERKTLSPEDGPCRLAHKVSDICSGDYRDGPFLPFAVPMPSQPAVTKTIPQRRSFQRSLDMQKLTSLYSQLATHSHGIRSKAGTYQVE